MVLRFRSFHHERRKPFLHFLLDFGKDLGETLGNSPLWNRFTKYLEPFKIANKLAQVIQMQFSKKIILHKALWTPKVIIRIKIDLLLFYPLFIFDITFTTL